MPFFDVSIERASSLVHASLVKFWSRKASRMALVALVIAAPAVASADEDDAMSRAVPMQSPPGAPPAKKPAQPQKPPQDKPKADDKDAAKDKDAKDKEAKDKAKKDAPAEEKAARGVVVIERAGQPIALGAVLGGDARVLTALSPLGSGNDLEARMPDGQTVRVKLGHHDRTWDLALLVPQSGRWSEGLIASSREPIRQDASMHAFSFSKGKVTASPIVLRGHKTLLGGDDKQLENAIELGSRVSPTDLGSPIVDEDGRVVAVLGRGCLPNEGRPCTPVAFGSPVAAIRNFLRTVPPSAQPPAAWLGIQGVSDVSGVAKGVRVTVVFPESPADEAHLKGGERDAADVILAVAGTPVTTPEALADAIRAHGVGEKIQLTLLSKGKYREVTVLLRAAPPAPAKPPAQQHPAELPPAGDPPPPSAPPPAKKPAAPPAPPAPPRR